MYFKTLKTSETGKKFQELSKKIDVCGKARNEFLDKYGIIRFTAPFNVGFGGFYEAETIETDLDLKVWKRSKDGYYSPRASTKQGKEILKEIENLPTISREQINSVVGYKESFLERIGYRLDNELFFGFELGKDWKFTPPSDCTEITITEYHGLFKT